MDVSECGVMDRSLCVGKWIQDSWMGRIIRTGNESGESETHLEYGDRKFDVKS